MPSLVFLCVANSARSQMAEGLARRSAPAGWHVHSAGSRPGALHPTAVTVMQEIGIDIARQRSKGLDEVPVAEATYVITLCAEEACPVTRARGRRLHWPLPDPALSGTPDAFRHVRDLLGDRLAAFWREEAVHT